LSFRITLRGAIQGGYFCLLSCSMQCTYLDEFKNCQMTLFICIKLKKVDSLYPYSVAKRTMSLQDRTRSRKSKLLPDFTVIIHSMNSTRKSNLARACVANTNWAPFPSSTISPLASRTYSKIKPPSPPFELGGLVSISQQQQQQCDR
jgi:hypothetical protein